MVHCKRFSGGWRSLDGVCPKRRQPRIMNCMNAGVFHPLVERWFVDRFGSATDPQVRGWPEIAAGRDTLIAAPTGSGKTLAAFLVCLDRLVRRWLDGTLDDKTYVVYVSPLKALGNDIHRNLQQPLAEIAALAEEAGHGTMPIRASVRSGDTPAGERQKMLRRPPHILVTTPESLYLLLTSAKGRELFGLVETVIVDEIHALVRDKRGSHLALTLARLDALAGERPMRIGLSATQRPMDDIARFLVGTERIDEAGEPRCRIIDGGHARELDLAIELPPSELSAVCSHEQWAEIYARLTELIAEHRSTLIFVNTRRLAERVAHHLRELLGEEAVAAHHGSLSREIRQTAETRLKEGKLRAIVATASLEMGIDIGYIDLVCQIGAPRSIATFLQRVGRAGHSLGKVPKGRLLPLTRDELLESMALLRAVRRGRLDKIEIPEGPLDILAQQIVAAVACENWDETALWELCRRAWPFRNVTREQFDEIVGMLSEGIVPSIRRGAYLHRDQINGQLRARRGARLAALTSGGAIPETALYRVVAEPEDTFVGTVDEAFAIESLAGDVFLLGNTSWRIQYVRAGEVRVRDADGAPPSVPFWFGEGPGRTPEFSEEVSQLRQDLAEVVRAGHQASSAGGNGAALPDWLRSACGAEEHAARQALSYVDAQLAAIGLVPTCEEVVFERFFDESGGMQLVIHAPFGSRINRAWGLALRKRFCRSFDFELQASADNDGIVLSLGPQHSVPLEDLFKMLSARNIAALLEQALLAVPLFQVRWRWNVTRALVVLRQQGGKRVPPHMQRFRSDDLLAAVFPETVGCLENHSGDVEIPDHPLVRQTMHDCLHEAMDLDGLVALFERVAAGGVRFVARDTREPSPFSYELLNANPYAFLDGAPLEERRTRAVATRRTLSSDDVRDLATLDPAAVRRVCRDAWPVVRSADELHDALLSLVVIDAVEAVPWAAWLESLIESRRATRIDRPNRSDLWTAAEHWPAIAAAYPESTAEPSVTLPERLRKELERHEAITQMVRGRVEHSGPTTADRLAEFLSLPTEQVAASLGALEGQGLVLRGSFSQAPSAATDGRPTEWCDRRLLARIHRMTMAGLRAQIRPVEPEVYLAFLARHHRLTGSLRWGGPVGAREAIAQLQGFELPAGAWESRVLAARMAQYDPAWLDSLFLSGEVVWGRMNPPRRDEDARPSAAGLSRVVPISLMLREDLPALLPEANGAPALPLRSGAQQVLAALSDRGASFFGELVRATGLLPTHLEEALRELAAAGQITSDAFAAVRVIAGEAKPRGRRRARRTNTAAAPVGRWSLFPGDVERAGPEAHVERWCRQLLARYGVVFRDVLVRETSAPAWHVLARVLRRMELRGEVRGGRFVAGVSGEQFALPESVERLREVRDAADCEPWIVVSAADPINLFGVITPGARVPATHRNALIVQGGQLVATRIAGVADFRQPVDEATQWTMRRAMTTGRRQELPTDVSAPAAS